MIKPARSKSALARLALAGACLAATASGQSTTPTPPITIVRDPQALVVLTNAEAALAGTTIAVTDVTVQASVNWIKGSDNETVTATFTSAGPETSQTVFNLSAGTLTQVRNGLAATTTQNGQKETIALHNVLNLHEWFFPQFFFKDLLQATGYVLGTPTQAAVGGRSQLTIQGSLVPPAQMDAITAQILSTASQFELVVDGTTLLPVSLSFVAHPDNDASRGYPVLYTFSNYQTQNGIQQPYHIQQFLQGTLSEDITIQSIAVNTGLTASQFNAQ